MSWLPILLAVLVVFAFAVVVLRIPKEGRALLGAALVFGLAGYALQGHPGLAGSPGRASERAADPVVADLVKRRQQLAGRPAEGGDMLIVSDALMRQGQYGTAAALLSQSVRKHPDEPELWLALANAELAHANGELTPPAQFAYRRAMLLGPDQPGSPYFLGLALISNGKVDEGRSLWAQTIAAAPPSAEWRQPLQAQLDRLDALIAQMAAERN